VRGEPARPEALEPEPDYLSYTLSKAALEAANTLLAQALAPRARVCGVAPGVTLVSGRWTPPDSNARTGSRRSNARRRPRTSRALCASCSISPAITGTTLLVDGGQHLQAQPRDVLFLAKDA
jgi:NAD(P)-dependent dehydrogenase (short-subunit alcohol dehydrogenase family)